MQISIKKLILFLFVSISFKSYSNAQDYGFFKFVSNVDSLYLVIDKDYDNIRKIADGDTVRLLTGLHTIEVSFPFSRKAQTQQKAYKDSISKIEVNFRSQEITRKTIQNNVAATDYFGSNLMIVTDNESEIYLDTTFLGTGFAMFLDNGPDRSIVIRNPAYKTIKVQLERKPGMNLYEHYLRPSKKRSKALSPIPGASQFYKSEYIKSSFIALGTVLSVYGIYRSSYQHQNAKNDLVFLKMEYNESFTPEQALLRGDKVEMKVDEVNRYRSQQIFFSSAALLVYSYNILDAIFHIPKGGFQQEPKPLKFYLSSELSDLGIINQASLKISLN